MNTAARPYPSVEQLARELRIVLRTGLHVARMARRIEEMPGLLDVCRHDANLDKYSQASAISATIRAAIQELGGGPYGKAVSALFGACEQTRGLLLPARRREAAAELDIQVATLMRWWEPDMLLEISSSLGNC